MVENQDFKNVMNRIGSDDEKLKKAVKEEMQKLIELGVSAAEAGETLIKKYRGEVEKKISELEGSERSVAITVRVLTLNSREVTAQGEKKRVYFGFLEDETGQCSYSLWHEPAFDIGDIIKIKNAYITTWNDTKRVNIRNTKDVLKSDRTVKTGADSRELKLEKTGNFRGRVKVLCRIVSLRKFDRGGIELFRGTVGDESGYALITLWKNFGVEENDCVEIDGGAVSQPFSIGVSEKAEVRKVNREVTPMEITPSQLIINMRNVRVKGKVFSISGEKPVRGKITDGKTTVPFVSWGKFKFPEGGVVSAGRCSVRSYMETPQLSIEDDAEIGEIEDPELRRFDTEKLVSRMTEAKKSSIVEGFLISIREGSGLLMRCGDCNRVLKENTCAIHGEVENRRMDLRIKGILDDGSDCATLILNRRLSEDILGKSLESYAEEAKKLIDTGVVMRDAEKLLFKPYHISGIVREDEVGKTMIADAIKVLSSDEGGGGSVAVDIEKKAEEILEERSVI